jgi:hypothetical protein
MKIDVKVETEFLAAILKKSEFVPDDLLQFVEQEHFQVPSYKWFVAILKDREWNAPAWDFIDQLLIDIPEENDRQKYRNQIWFLYQKELEFEDDASKKFRAYISYCIANSKVRDAFTGFEKTSRIDFLLDSLTETVESAKRALEGNKYKLVDYADNYETRMSHRKLVRDNPSISPRILTGIRELDIQFTFKAPMVIDLLAPFKRYKSIFLNAFGYAALLQGFDVAHITYENSEEMTMDRYDAIFTELNYERISNLIITPDERQSIDKTFEWMSRWKNRLKIIKGIPEETSVLDINAALEAHRRTDNWTPDVMIFDYLNIIAPSKRHKEDWKDQKQIVWDLKWLAEKWNVPIFEASQAKIEGATANRLNMGHRGLSTAISQALDCCIAIDQTEEEREEGLIILSPHFVRGAQILIPEIVLESDLPRMIVSRELHRLWEHAIKVNPY